MSITRAAASIRTAASAKPCSLWNRSCGRHVSGRAERPAAIAMIRIHPMRRSTRNRSSWPGFGPDVFECHVKFQAQPEAHTHHAAASEGSRCVSCHMPRIMNGLMAEARYHQIDDIPDAAMTARFGQADSPNACLTCHKDRDSAWLRRNMTAWSQGGDRANRGMQQPKN